LPKTFKRVGDINITIMKTQELKAAELKEINGGSILNSGDSSSSSGIGGALGIGNLLSFSQASQDGDDAQASSFSLGNGINTDVASMFDQLTK
jgi:hypothetical protein